MELVLYLFIFHFMCTHTHTHTHMHTYTQAFFPLFSQLDLPQLPGTIDYTLRYSTSIRQPSPNPLYLSSSSIHLSLPSAQSFSPWCLSSPGTPLVSCYSLCKREHRLSLATSWRRLGASLKPLHFYHLLST